MCHYPAVCAYWWALVGLGRGLLAEEGIVRELLLQSHSVDGGLVGAKVEGLGVGLSKAPDGGVFPPIETVCCEDGCTSGGM